MLKATKYLSSKEKVQNFFLVIWIVLYFDNIYTIDFRHCYNIIQAEKSESHTPLNERNDTKSEKI
jgi:hypothetical protein